MNPLTHSLDEFLRSRRDAGAEPSILALGEPMHGEQTFLWLRNELFAHLVEHWGYRSIAVESSYPRGVGLDAQLRNDPASLSDGTANPDEATTCGFSHDFGEAEANRALVRWMAERNRVRRPDERLAFFGFDTPTEMMGTDSPGETLEPLYAYLREHLGGAALPYDWDAISERVGEPGRWTDTAAVLDPARSPGNTADARELRLIIDDLLTTAATEAPRLVAASSLEDLVTAELHGRNAAMLLRYHSALADPAPSRLAHGLALRDAQMADNLRTLAESAVDRGPTLVFAHNSHLLAAEARWQLGDQDLRWSSAGALLRARLGSRYAVLATALGSAPQHEIGEPPPNTLEGRIAAASEELALVPVEWLRAQVGAQPEQPEQPGLRRPGDRTAAGPRVRGIPADDPAAGAVTGLGTGRAGTDHPHETASVDQREGVMRASYFPLEIRQLDGLDAVLWVRRAGPHHRAG